MVLLGEASSRRPPSRESIGLYLLRLIHYPGARTLETRIYVVAGTRACLHLDYTGQCSGLLRSST